MLKNGYTHSHSTTTARFDILTLLSPSRNYGSHTNRLEYFLSSFSSATTKPNDIYSLPITVFYLNY